MNISIGRYVGLRHGKYWERTENSDYYCGRCGYPVTDHDSFCPECGGAFRESDASDLEAENAKLREFAEVAFMCLRLNEPRWIWEGLVNDAIALGIEVE